MSKITLKTYLLIEDIIPMSEALNFTEKEALVLLKYKEVMKGLYLPEEIKEEIKTSKIYIVWKCPILEENDTLLPAGRKPKKGCGHYNIMSTKSNENKIKSSIFQTSPCEICGKRSRQNNFFHFFDSRNAALKFASKVNKELEV